MKLYTHPLSANAHKVKLLLGFLGLRYDEVDVDIPGGEQHGEAFGAISIVRQIPVLDDGYRRLRDAQAILVYVAGAYDAERRWWPVDAYEQGLIAQWLAFAALELQSGINLARLHFLLGLPVDLPVVQAQGEKTLALLDCQLAGRDWLELDRPTIADCACIAFPARAGEAGHDVSRYPHVARWIERMQALPGFTPMMGFGAPLVWPRD